MFWDDIESIKETMETLCQRIYNMQLQLNAVIVNQGDASNITRAIEEILYSEDEGNTFHRLHNKINSLIADEARVNEVILAKETLDKLDDYMKNSGKLNDMINEFKGCVSLARGAIEDRKKLTEEEAKTAVLSNMTEEIYKSMRAFIHAADRLEQKAHFKIDYIYKEIDKIADFLQKMGEKSIKKTKKKGKKMKASPDSVCEKM